MSLLASRLEKQIEAFIAERTDHASAFMPSGRLGLYLALRILLRPGDRLMMSPLQDDVIFFTVLAAGLRPVFAPVSATDGNIDAIGVPEAMWAEVHGVLTTNLYGLPDRTAVIRKRCDHHGIPLIEDAAHALEINHEGTTVGSLGDAAIFSLSKHARASGGGVLSFAEEAWRQEAVELRNRLWDRGTWGDAIAVIRPLAERLAIHLGAVGPARRVARRLLLAERAAYRMPLAPAELRSAIAAGAGIDRFHRWLRFDLGGYRRRPSVPALQLMLAGLRGVARDRRRRIDGVERLRRHPAVAAAVRNQPVQPHFRVPLLVEDRDQIRHQLARRVLGIGYIYDPPLDEYARSEFADASPSPEAARWFARHVLPVDPLEAKTVLRSLDGARPARGLHLER